MSARPKRRKTPPAEGGAFQIESIQCLDLEQPKHSTASAPAATLSSKLISIQEACQHSGEKPATVIRWCVHDKIGGHVKAGNGGAWMVDSIALERLLAERAAAA